MSQIDSLPHERRLLAEVADQLREHVPTFVAQMTQLIQHRVPDYAASSSGNRRQVIEHLLTIIGRQFCDLLRGHPTAPEFSNAVQRFAAAGARSGDRLEAFTSALSIGRVGGHRFLEILATDRRIHATALGALKKAVNAYLGALERDVVAGYQRGVTELRQSPGETRRTLALALVSGSWSTRCSTLAEHIEWKVPEDFLVIAINADERELLPRLEVDHVFASMQEHFVIVTEAACAEDVFGFLEESLLTYATYTFVDERGLVPDAVREVRAAACLVNEGSIRPGVRWISCGRYAQEIWLRNVPTQCAGRRAEMLAPLDDLGEQFRTKLIETLRVYLVTRESAPKLAKTLGVHPQTMRARLRILHDRLGHVIDDPEQSILLLLLLNALAPTKGVA